jgi:hypothetical protein
MRTVSSNDVDACAVVFWRNRDSFTDSRLSAVAFELERAAAFLQRYRVTKDVLISRMGGIP